MATGWSVTPSVFFTLRAGTDRVPPPTARVGDAAGGSLRRCCSNPAPRRRSTRASWPCDAPLRTPRAYLAGDKVGWEALDLERGGLTGGGNSGDVAGRGYATRASEKAGMGLLVTLLSLQSCAALSPTPVRTGPCPGGAYLAVSGGLPRDRDDTAAATAWLSLAGKLRRRPGVASLHPPGPHHTRQSGTRTVRIYRPLAVSPLGRGRDGRHSPAGCPVAQD